MRPPPCYGRKAAISGTYAAFIACLLALKAAEGFAFSVFRDTKRLVTARLLASLNPRALGEGPEAAYTSPRGQMLLRM